MARIRTVKPEFFTSEDIVGLSMAARLLYIATWCEADKAGRLRWKPGTFKLRYFPGDAVDIDSMCNELTDRGLVVLYGDDLAYVPKFHLHQHINPRESESTLPAPPTGRAVSDDETGHDPEDGPPDGHASRTRNDASATRQHASVTRREEGKGRERKGKEGSPQPPAGAGLAGFDRFWAAYPRKKAKGSAEKAFRAVKPSELQVTEMVAAIGRATTSVDWRKDGGKFIPYPATWLRDKRWLDEQDAVESVAAKTSGQLRLAGGFVA